MRVSEEDVEKVIKWRESRGSDPYLSQCMMWMEESGEYLTALTNNIEGHGSIDAVSEELADTIIMLWHLAYLFGYDEVVSNTTKSIETGNHPTKQLPKIFSLSTKLSQFHRGRIKKDEMVIAVSDCISSSLAGAQGMGILAATRAQFSKKMDALMRRVNADIEDNKVAANS